MRIFAIALAILGTVNAQAPTTRDLHLRGGRFKPLSYDTMTPEQKTLVASILSGPRTSLDGPFNVLLRSPDMGDLAQKFGAQMRYHSSLPTRLNEFAILITARFWTAQFEWQAHHKIALTAGLSPAIIDALAAGKRPTSMQPDEEAVYNFCTEVLSTKQVGDATFQAAVEKFGERGVVDMLGVVGYYQFVSMVLNVDRYPLPDGVQPELKPLRRHMAMRTTIDIPEPLHEAPASSRGSIWYIYAGLDHPGARRHVQQEAQRKVRHRPHDQRQARR
jgi:4-carboxymuconolactone decarboxylase